MNNKMKTIIISGANSGIGNEIANKLKNFNLIILFNTTPKNNFQDKFPNCIKAVKCDFTNLNETDFVINEVLTSYPEIYGYINVSGDIGETGPLEKTSLNSWTSITNLNFLAPVIISNQLIEHFKKRGEGKFIYFGGGGSAYGYPVLPQYSASKTALVRYVENLELEVRDFNNIQSIVVAPGAVKTKMFKAVKNSEKEYGETSKIRSFSKVEEVAIFVEYLLTNDFKKLSGRLIHLKDDWKKILNNNLEIEEDSFRLRRIQI